MSYRRIQRWIVSLLVSPFVTATSVNAREPQQTVTNFFELKATAIDGRQVSLDEYRGKVVLVVNTASRCGFTQQYEELEKLYETYQGRGLVVLGFPSNDFANQEPGSNEEIKNFCKTHFGVTFPMFTRATVRGPGKQPVYHFLTEQSGDEFAGEIGWNFEKFLIDRKGHVRARYGSITTPQSARVIAQTEELLAEDVTA